MTRPDETKYPSRLSYVLKLRADASADALAGRLENLVTGQRLAFTSTSGLLDAIAHELRTGAGDPPAE